MNSPSKRTLAIRSNTLLEMEQSLSINQRKSSVFRDLARSKRTRLSLVHSLRTVTSLITAQS